MKGAAALLAGLLFGIGLAISGMTSPDKVIGFLDITGAWDPSLAFVMGGALLVFMPGYFLLVKPSRQSLLGEPYSFSQARQVDGRLLGGSALFGIGWGLCGVCPGPAIAGLGTGNTDLLWALGGIAAGALAQGLRASRG